jgi:adenylosuccinate synthase
MMNGVTDLIMMKSDVLNDFDTIKVAVGYDVNGKRVDYFPYESDEQITPIYREFEGWNSDICNIRNYDDFPQQFKDYVAFIEAETGVPVKIISVGPDREETIIR